MMPMKWTRRRTRRRTNTRTKNFVRAIHSFQYIWLITFIEDEVASQPSILQLQDGNDVFSDIIDSIGRSAKERAARDGAAKIRSKTPPSERRKSRNLHDETLIQQSNLPGIDDLLICSVRVEVCFLTALVIKHFLTPRRKAWRPTSFYN